MLIQSSMSIFSQTFFSNNEIKRIERKAINTIRNSFNISNKTQLFATIVIEVIDSTQTFVTSPTFDINTKIGIYLKNLKIFHYEIFVYDETVKNVYIVNRIFLGENKFKKKYYLGNKDDFILSKFLLSNGYDYILNLGDVFTLVNNPTFLCFKEGKMDLAYLKNEDIKSISVCYNDNFAFLIQN